MSEDEIILTHILQCRPLDLVLNKPALTKFQQEQFESYKNRRAAGEPLQYILGTCNFMGLELKVDPSVLVPRPETEQLVDVAIKYISLSFPNVSVGNPGIAQSLDPRLKLSRMTQEQELIHILDLGTGSGNIAIALAKFIPQAQVISVDLSAEALEIAKANARQHKVENRVKFIQGDILLNSFPHFPPPGEECFDLIISNPPYIPTNQLKTLPRDVQQEPALALDGGSDGLNFYRSIIKYTPGLLRKGACLMMEFGDGQAEAIKRLIEDQKGFSNIEIIQDLAGRDRIIKAIK